MTFRMIFLRGELWPIVAEGSKNREREALFSAGFMGI
jgi:hypothetical protein